MCIYLTCICMYIPLYTYVCMRIFIHIHVCTRMRVSVYMRRYIYIYIYTYMCVCVHVYLDTKKYVTQQPTALRHSPTGSTGYSLTCFWGPGTHTYVYTYICMYVCMYIYMCMCIHMHKDSPGHQLHQMPAVEGRRHGPDGAAFFFSPSAGANKGSCAESADSLTMGARSYGQRATFSISILFGRQESNPTEFTPIRQGRAGAASNSSKPCW